VASARADEAGCPRAASAFEANGTKLSKLDGGASRTLEILAIGSSSTEGIGASSPANAYPAQLEDELTHDDGIAADVKNAGVGGELAIKTLRRLKAALKTGWAELVIWQVGTNDALVGVDETLFRATVESGVAAARAAGVPLLLIDPQFTPKSPDEARYERFVEIVDEIGARDHVPVLSRFAMMKRRGTKDARALLSKDGLHMNDLGYRCLAHAIAEAIEGAAVGAKL
jgi:acyl-CoA thioesterase I